MKKISILFLTALMASGLMARPAAAAEKYPVEIGPQIGYLFIEGDSDVKCGLLYGARFSTFLIHDVAGEISVVGGKFDIRNTSRKADVLLPTLELQKYFTGSGLWRPYIAAGAGYLQINRDRSLGQNKIHFAALYGAGVKWQFSPSFLARFDLRHIMDSESGRGTHNGLASIGVSWIYGNEEKAPKKPAPAPAPEPAAPEPAPPAPEVAPEPPAQAVPEKEWILQGVKFESGSDKLTADSKQSLDEAFEILNTHPNVRVEVQGNTDRTGSPEVNVKLSEKRAVAVKNYLVGRGIAADRLETRGLGFTNPIASNSDPEGRAKNRRIEFKVLSR